MWAPLAAELGIPWRAAEAMHWQLGESDMARRAGVTPFSLSNTSSASSAPSGMSSMVPPGSNLPGTGPLPSPYAQYAPQYLAPQQQRPDMLFPSEYPPGPQMGPLPPQMGEPQMRDPRDPSMGQSSLAREVTEGRMGGLPGLAEMERGGSRRTKEEKGGEMRGPPGPPERYPSEGTSRGKGRAR